MSHIQNTTPNDLNTCLRIACYVRFMVIAGIMMMISSGWADKGATINPQPIQQNAKNTRQTLKKNKSIRQNPKPVHQRVKKKSTHKIEADPDTSKPKTESYADKIKLVDIG